MGVTDKRANNVDGVRLARCQRARGFRSGGGVGRKLRGDKDAVPLDVGKGLPDDLLAFEALVCQQQEQLVLFLEQHIEVVVPEEDHQFLVFQLLVQREDALVCQLARGLVDELLGEETLPDKGFLALL